MTGPALSAADQDGDELVELYGSPGLEHQGMLQVRNEVHW